MAVPSPAEAKCREKTARGNAFETQEAARGYLEVLLYQTRYRVEPIVRKRLKKTLEVYRCQCGKWHVGTGAKKYRIARKYRKKNRPGS